MFFDFDSTKITGQAAQTISDAARTAQQTGTIQIEVTGHTDTSGSPAYNQRLSVRRAEAVKKELMARHGIKANQIVTVGRGESQPMVATGDGVREPSNRRGQIVLVVR